jgi:hypothetical protein
MNIISNNNRRYSIEKWESADAITFQWTPDKEWLYGAMATATKPGKRSVDAMYDASKGLGQLGINTEIDPTTMRLDSQRTMKPMVILATGRHPVSYHGKQYNGVPSNSGRVEATEEPRVYGDAEEAIVTKQYSRYESLAYRTNIPHDRMTPEVCPPLGYQPIHISIILEE